MQRKAHLKSQLRSFIEVLNPALEQIAHQKRKVIQKADFLTKPLNNSGIKLSRYYRSASVR